MLGTLRRPHTAVINPWVDLRVDFAGVQLSGYRKNQELTVISQAMYQARDLAMTRMEEEADKLGADGVVGVRIEVGPFTSDLSGQDFGLRLRTGHPPLGQVGRNVELTNYTQALYDARELAMTRMQSEAKEPQATGMVGVQLRENSHGWRSHTIAFFAVGTRSSR